MRGDWRIASFVIVIGASVFLATSTSGQAPTDRWELVKLSTNKSTLMFASRDRQTTDGYIKSIWSMMVYKDFQISGKNVAYTMLKLSFDCRADTFRSDYAASYSKDDAVIEQEPGSGRFEPIVPESLIDGVAQRSCATKPRSDQFTLDTRAAAIQWAWSYFAK